ncbi:Petal formation-expressed [Sesbania bispinosa]|nr:Petal formation-expressed [Sesbania bispinosa]
MSSLQASGLLNPLSSSCSSSLKRTKCAINFPKLPRTSFSVPKASRRSLVIDRVTDKAPILEKNDIKTLHDHDHDDELFKSTNSKTIAQLYAVLEAVSDRIEMHNNVREQRDNWNTLLLNSINMITLTASTMAGVAGTATCSGAPLLALKLSSAILFSAATGMLLVMNKIQPSQLAEEQRNATRLFKQLQSHIETTIALGNPNEGDVRDAMEKVLALDKAYPLPLLGAMLEKFPAKFEPARWWPSQRKSIMNNYNDKLQQSKNKNGWNVELEKEMKEVVEVVKRKDMEDYERLGNLALKINKTLAISGPLLTGIAAVGSVFAGDGSWTTLVPVLAGALATVVNAFEHGGQVGMVFEMYRNCGGFFQLLEETIEMTIEEKDLEKRENGELFEMKMALQLGRSVSQLRELASKSASYRMEGSEIDEFASKLF